MFSERVETEFDKFTKRYYILAIKVLEVELPQARFKASLKKKVGRREVAIREFLARLHEKEELLCK